MKNKSISLALVSIFALFGCNPVETVDANINISDIQAAIIGSWQLSEKGIEMAMHEGHICSDPENMAQDKITYMITWENVTSDEKRNFKQNGDYNTYLEGKLACQGSYKIDENGYMLINTACRKFVSEKIMELKVNVLTLKEGNTYYKYRKAN